MFSIRSSCHGQISKQSSFFLRLIHTSIASSSTDLQPHFMVDFLIDSLNFSQQEAISASTKVRHLKSSEKPQSVIHFLRTYNLSDSEIKSIVLSQPDILIRKVDKTLQPKFNILTETGFSGPDLVSVITRDPNLLVRGVHTSIIPALNFLRRILGTNEKIVKVMKRSHWPFYGKFFKINVLLLEKYGVSSKDIERVITRNPRLVTQSPVRLKEKLIQVEKEFGITPGSRMFSYGLSAVCSMNKPNLQKKFELFKSFGWCELDVFTLARSQPICFTHSEERLSKSLDFFLNEIGYEPSWIATRGCNLMYSLEKRVKPRFEVFKVLKGKVEFKRDFHSMLCLADVDFLKQVVERHKEDLPVHLYQRFTKSSKNLELL